MATSYNGWQASESRSSIGVRPFTVEGVEFPSGVKAGDVATVLAYVAVQIHRRVEKLTAGTCWGYAYRKNRNANNLSCHSSGTAIDVNAPRHPNGKRGTFKADQVRTIRAILAEVAPVVRWGGDFSGTPDEMHFEIVGNAQQVARVAAAIRAKARRAPAKWEGDMGGAPHSGLIPRQQPKAKTLIAHVQYCLAARGYTVRRDGVWDAACEKALKTFQTQRQLKPDGVVGGITWEHLHTPQ